MADYANPSRGLYGISISLATIRARTVSSPAWWKNTGEGASIKDENVIFAIYDKCLEMEKEWQKELNIESEQAEEEAPASTEATQD